MHQGWPKYAMHLWMASLDAGLAAVCYAPCEVSATVADGKNVKFVEKTEYPFDGKIELTFYSDIAVTFPLHLRIPLWAENAVISINGEHYKKAESGTFITINRKWSNNDIVEISLPMDIRTSKWHNNSIGIERGPLIFALKIKENWKRFRGKGEYVYKTAL